MSYIYNFINQLNLQNEENCYHFCFRINCFIAIIAVH